MPIAPLPAPLQSLSGRHFSFDPPIRNIEDNHWLYQRASWNEIVLANRELGNEVCVPRQFLGDVTEEDDGSLVMRLTRELEWHGGVVLPRERRVIEFPSAPHPASLSQLPASRPAAVVNIRLEPRRQIGTRKWIAVALLLGVVAFTIITDIARASQAYRARGATAGYRSVLGKLMFLR